MVEGGGVLQLRGAEPYSLATPTGIEGSIDDQTGNLSGLMFSTPQVNIEREITSPLNATVFIDADFSQVAPGTGVVDSDGTVTIQQSLAVDLHIEVVPDGSTTPLDVPGDCRAAPINLILESTTPYNEDTDRVTVATEDFTVPPVAINTDCVDIIGNQVNEELGGSGHALSLLLEGDLVVPDPEGCETTTDVLLDPTGSSPLGAELTFTSTTATVATDEECIQAATDGLNLSGTVDFLRGSTIIGSGDLDGSGEATFSTTGLPAGTQQLSARFRGNHPFLKSPSAAIEHLVTTQPTVSTTIPDFIEIGQTVEFEYTVNNSQFSTDLDDVRVDITPRSFTTVPVISRWDGAAWQPVPMLGGSPDRYAALPVFDLASGAERTEKLRITGGPGSQPGQLEMIFEVKLNSAPVAPAPTATALGRGSKFTTFHTADRQPSELISFYPDPIGPHTVRQGETVTVELVGIMPFISGHEAGGYFEYFLDGGRVAVGLWPSTPRPGEEMTRVPAFGGTSSGTALIHLPPDTPTGEREITVRYSGDSVFLPSQVTFPFTVLPARGPSYQCFSEGLPPVNVRVNVVAQANTPTAAPPGPLDLDHLDVTILTDRSLNTVFSPLYGTINDDGPTAVGERGLTAIDYVFSGGGTGTATGLTQTNSLEPLPTLPYPSTDPDRVWTFNGETGSTTIAGDVGDIVPITLDDITVHLVADGLGVPYDFVCTPVGEPALLGEVRVAGVDLTVAPAGSVRAGQDVVLTANTGNPTGAGVAEFLDGTDTIGVVSVAGGMASMTTDELEPGDHTLKVRYYPQPAGPAQVSPVVELEVFPAVDCEAFAEEGNGAVVRLVYMELLGRCPDQAGFDHWVGRLDGGTSSGVFARSISRTPEAVGRVVDDAYEAMLGRAPDAGGRAFWVERMRTGSGRYDQLLADLAASPEFWSLSGSTRAGFVTRIYDRLLNRAPEPAGLEHWTDRLAAGTSRRALVLTLANQPEPLSHLVAKAYDEILNRTPSISDQSNGSTYLRGTGDRSGLYAQLIGTGEFSIRAQGFPNPED